MDAGQIEAILPQPTVEWDAIFADVNAWRGACVHHFSAVEMAVTETLFALSEVPAGGSAIRLRHLIGQRLEDLTAALAPGGPFADAGKAAQRELVQYRERHEDFRNLLCHGFAKVAVERSGRWILVIRALAIRTGKAERSTLVIDHNEAMTRLDSLKRDGSKLGSALRLLRQSVAS
jgi:hypothetical protein